MTKHEEFLWELLLHEIETKAELTRIYFDCFTYTAKTEQLEEFQLHKKQRAEHRKQQFAELDCETEKRHTEACCENG